MIHTGKIIITGGAGFIGFNLIKALNKKGITDIILVDNIKTKNKNNLEKISYDTYFDKDEFIEKIKNDDSLFNSVSSIIHLGACSDTTEMNKEYLLKNNTEYSKILSEIATKYKLQFIYASSAATYGDGSNGYSDNERKLHQLNYYGQSKYLFDEWLLDNPQKPKQWVGLKFFNVYGPYEYHKDKMASVIFHGFNQIQKDKNIKLFKSYKKGYADGEQKRDFVYINDVIEVILFFLDNPEKSGIYNVGTGKARTFLDLALGIFSVLQMEPNIQFIEMPESLKEKYQYYTQADMHKLRNIGYIKPFYELEAGIKDYIENYLLQERK